MRTRYVTRLFLPFTPLALLEKKKKKKKVRIVRIRPSRLSLSTLAMTGYAFGIYRLILTSQFDYIATSVLAYSPLQNKPHTISK